MQDLKELIRYYFIFSNELKEKYAKNQYRDFLKSSLVYLRVSFKEIGVEIKDDYLLYKGIKIYDYLTFRTKFPDRYCKDDCGNYCCLPNENIIVFEGTNLSFITAIDNTKERYDTYTSIFLENAIKYLRG